MVWRSLQKGFNKKIFINQLIKKVILKLSKKPFLCRQKNILILIKKKGFLAKC